MADGAFALENGGTIWRLRERGMTDECADEDTRQRDANLQSEIFNLKSHGSKE